MRFIRVLLAMVVLASLAAASWASVAAAEPHGPSTSSPSGRPGCASTRVATAYDTQGDPLPTQPGGAPVPCLVATGYPTVETHIAVTGDGSVVDEPAIVTSGLLGSATPPAPGPHFWQPTSPSGIVVSNTQGGSWRFVEPGAEMWASNDNALYVDPGTGRLFMEMLSGGSFGPGEPVPVANVTLLESPDDGANWSETPLPGFVLSENARFTAAPAPRGGTPTAGGYPDVTYWCGNQTVGFTHPVIVDRTCFRSLDGGVSWQRRAILFPSLPSPCGTNHEDFTAIDGNYPQGAPDGSLYVMVGCNSTSSFAAPDSAVYLARSTDEAGTFSVLRSPAGAGTPAGPLRLPLPPGATSPELRLGRSNGAESLVLVYQITTGGGAQVLMRQAPIPAIGARGGLSSPLHWSRPVALTPKGVSSIPLRAVEVRGGELALSSLAEPTSSSGTYNGYLTVVPNLSSTSTIWTAQLNDSSTPVSRAAPEEAKDDFIGIAIGPDGGPWASFFSPCSADAAAQHDPACEGAYVGGRPVNGALQGGNDRGLVGSLRF